MNTPSNPGVSGVEKTTHDGMDDAGHQEQAGHAGGQESKEKKEGSE